MYNNTKTFNKQIIKVLINNYKYNIKKYNKNIISIIKFVNSINKYTIFLQLYYNRNIFRVYNRKGSRIQQEIWIYNRYILQICNRRGSGIQQKMEIWILFLIILKQ